MVKAIPYKDVELQLYVGYLEYAGYRPFYVVIGFTKRITTLWRLGTYSIAECFASKQYISLHRLIRGMVGAIFESLKIAWVNNVRDIDADRHKWNVTFRLELVDTALRKGTVGVECD